MVSRSMTQMPSWVSRSIRMLFSFVSLWVTRRGSFPSRSARRATPQSSFRPVQLIGFQRGEKLTEADFSVVEMGNGLVKCPGGIIPEHVLEPPERPSRRRKQLRRGRLIAVGVFDKGHQPPHSAVGVGDKIRALSGSNQTQGLPGRVAALGKNLSAQIGRNAHKILHHFLRMGKRGLGQPLQYQLDSAALWGTARYAEGIVDVPLAVAGNVQNRTRQLVGRQNL